MKPLFSPSLLYNTLPPFLSLRLLVLNVVRPTVFHGDLENWGLWWPRNMVESWAFLPHLQNWACLGCEEAAVGGETSRPRSALP